MMRNRCLPAAVAWTFALAAAGCTPIQAQAGAAPAPRARDYVPADVQFMQGMIGHHAQAVVMAAMVPTHGANDRIQLLARRIDLSQRDEIAFIKQWLQDRKLPLPDSTDHMHHQMPGMLTAEQLRQLDQARGAAFDRLFLTYMIQHHEGALKMVQDLFAAPGGGQEPELFRFAADVDADQRAEIERMQQMSRSLPPRSPTT